MQPCQDLAALRLSSQENAQEFAVCDAAGDDAVILTGDISAADLIVTDNVVTLYVATATGKLKRVAGASPGQSQKLKS